MAQTRRRLAARRDELGLTQQALAELLEVDVRSVARYESGDSTPRVAQRRRFAAILEWTVPQLVAVLNGESDVPPDSHAVPEWLSLYASLEQGASKLWSWQPVTVHALLQTPAYAAAVERVAPEPPNEDTVASHVDLRRRRQGVLHRQPNPVQLSVVLDESTLHRATGGRDVMVEQLEHLACAAEWPNIELRLLPLASGTHAAAFGAFNLVASTSTEPKMVCTSDRTGVRYLESENAIKAHKELFDHLCEQSPPAQATPDLIRKTIKEIYR